MTNCVPINFYERDQQGKENAQMDVTTNAYMTKMMEATSPNELPIGWCVVLGFCLRRQHVPYYRFSTSSHYDSNDVLGLYEYFFKLVNAGLRSAEQTHKIQPILLTMQCAELESGHGLQPKALLRCVFKLHFVEKTPFYIQSSKRSFSQSNTLVLLPTVATGNHTLSTGACRCRATLDRSRTRGKREAHEGQA